MSKYSSNDIVEAANEVMLCLNMMNLYIKDSEYWTEYKKRYIAARDKWSVIESSFW